MYNKNFFAHLHWSQKKSNIYLSLFAILRKSIYLWSTKTIMNSKG